LDNPTLKLSQNLIGGHAGVLHIAVYAKILSEH
jgi:hypothetical protein